LRAIPRTSDYPVGQSLKHSSSACSVDGRISNPRSGPLTLAVLVIQVYLDLYVTLPAAERHDAIAADV